jgi:putative selenate reductase
MAELAPLPFAVLARRMFRELERREAIFDLPARKFVLGDARHDFSVRFHGHQAATPFGPAAGPNTQLAQNIVLSWLAGGRIMELKTVQVKDDLVIPRPCIDMQTVGYNVEWSQELKLEQSLEEYVKAALLIRMLVASDRLPLAPLFDHTVFDMSVGYDLAGIKSERVLAFLAGMADTTPLVGRLRREIPAELAHLRDVEMPAQLSNTLTLSTFHGCPPDEIERIVDFLLRERQLSCVIKLNPTLLGPEAMHTLLHERLGYTDLRVPDAAFDKDTTWQQAVDFTGRLGDTAASLGLGLGVKFSNTLIVENHRPMFPASEPVMYLSGPPLHVLAINLVHRFRHTLGDRFPISFSAGIERANFPDAVALGMVPVTVCSDLLKPGGYARGFGCFEELARRMDDAGAATVDEFIRRAYGTDGPADLAAAKLRNTALYVERATADPRYGAEKNRRVPRKIGSQLQLFDCVSCDKCIAVCPNDANFVIALPRAQPRQFINFADFCNDCGNCDVFCPEDGGPYLLKPRVFINRERWAADAPRDAILIEADAVTGRFGGALYRGDEASEYADTLNQLRAALLAPNEVNYVSASF